MTNLIYMRQVDEVLNIGTHGCIMQLRAISIFTINTNYILVIVDGYQV